jgi:hypothetical protein
MEPDGVNPADIVEFVNGLAAMAEANRDQPEPIAAGTFALYPMPDGGMMFVTDVQGGVMQGIKHHRIPPPMIRAAAALAGGGSRIDALKAMMTRRPKAIGSAQQ